MTKTITRKGAIALGLVLGITAGPVLATHSWNGYHWVRTTSELTVPVGNNVDANWDSYVRGANVDWNKSAVINSPLVAGSSSSKRCSGVAGTIQVCNSTYGRNGWLGLASISIANGHISQGTTKLNDTYFNTAQYNTPSWKAVVACQEIGHDYGLGHQDENSATDLTNSCMDYTNLPAGNEHPDAHDYDELLTIYNHLENAAIASFGGNGNAGAADVGETPSEWGRATHVDRQGRPDEFERIDGPGRKTLTHVFWAVGEGPRNFRG